MGAARRAVGGSPGRRAGAVAALAAAICCAPTPTWAFGLEGHEVIEAAAYRRLLAMDAVPGTGQPGVSGRALLASLIATGVLIAPPCFDRAHPRGDCGADARLDLPLGFWPVLGSGGPDLVIDRQLGERGQCQHFMARTSDGLTPVDPRLGVPEGLGAPAYRRCIQRAGAAFDGILLDPPLAQWHVAGAYVLMHAIEDSFSAAHVNRNANLEIVHLLSWKLLDGPRVALRGPRSFPAATHHGVTDDRDADYLQADAVTPEGRACGAFHQPYAVPESCLSDRAKAATDAIVDFLVATYQLRASAAAESRTATLFSASSDRERTVWVGFVKAHLPSASAAVELPAGPLHPLPRPDVFLGVQGLAGAHTWGVGVWAAELLFVRPFLPFALGLSASAGLVRSDGIGHLAAGGSVSLLLPLVRRFTIGASPVGVKMACTTELDSCTPDVAAAVGLLLIPMGDATWIGVMGPDWSWTQRAWSRTWAGLAIGWSHETGPRHHAPPSEAIASWNPPRPDEVRSYRSTRSTRAIYLAATALSRPDDTFVGVGFDWRRDRDVWNRRAGLAPGLQLEIDQGAIAGTLHGGAVAIAPTLRAYVIADRIALTATPALMRAGAIADKAVGFDIAARGGIAIDVGGLEIAIDSPPLSYVSRERWNALPFTVRLGALLD